MKTLKKIALFAIIGMLFVTCKKEELPPNSIVGQPAFSFSGIIGGISMNWQAGVNNYYMYSSYSQDSLGVYGFMGNLQNTSTNKNSIQITINDYRVSAKNTSVSASHIDSSFSQPAYYYYPQTGTGDTTYSIKFSPLIYAGGSAQSYSYSFGDGSSSTAISPTHTYTTTGTYTTALTIKFAAGNVTMTNPITILKTQPQLWIDSIHSTNSFWQVLFTFRISNGATPYKYNLNFGDGTPPDSSSSNNTVDTVTHQYTTTATFPVSLKVTDNNNHSETYNYAVWASDSNYMGKGLMDYAMSPPQQVITTAPNKYPLSNVTILYTNSAGIVYTSNNASQPVNNSKFVINSVSSYTTNLNNEPTKMLNVTFSCMLYPVLGGAPIQASNCNAVIAVAY